MAAGEGVEVGAVDEDTAGPGGVSVSRKDAEPPGATASENGSTAHCCSATGLKICSKESLAEGGGVAAGVATTLLVPKTTLDEASDKEVELEDSSPAGVLVAGEI